MNRKVTLSIVLALAVLALAAAAAFTALAVFASQPVNAPKLAPIGHCGNCRVTAPQADGLTFISYVVRPYPGGCGSCRFTAPQAMDAQFLFQRVRPSPVPFDARWARY